MNAATFIFVFTYILVALGENSPRKLDRPTAALLGAVLMVATGALSRAQALEAIDFSTLGAAVRFDGPVDYLDGERLPHLAGS
jgi:Na+/H+ antiporter NhaD/arsenite permease-like protein